MLESSSHTPCLAKVTWIFETYSDADWAGNRVHRKSTSYDGIHFLNRSFLCRRSRTQKDSEIDHREPELHSIVSSMSDAIFVRRCLVLQVHYIDSSSVRQLVSRQGCGKIRHLSGKMQWVQGTVHDGEVHIVQVPIAFNAGDIGTKPLPKRRLLALMWETGMVYVDTQEPVGEAERADGRACKGFQRPFQIDENDLADHNAYGPWANWSSWAEGVLQHNRASNSW